MQSPHIGQRPMSPPSVPGSPAPYRPGSPFRNRQSTIGVPLRVGSPAPASPQPTTPTFQKPVPDIEVDLVVRTIPREDLSVEKPFRIAFTLNVSALVPLAPAGQSRRKRNLAFAIQHVQPPRLLAPPPTKAPAQTEPWSPRLPSSGFSTPSPYATPHRADFHDALARKLLVASPRPTLSEGGSDSGYDVEGRESARETPLPPGMRKVPEVITLPPPFANSDSNPNSEPRQHSHDVVFQGPSALFLPAMHFSVADGQILEHGAVTEVGRTPKHDRNWSESTITTTDSEADSELDVPLGMVQRSVRTISSHQFELEYLPLRSGFLTIGGIRIILVDDKLVDESDDSVIETGKPKGPENIRTVKEYDVVGELWVRAEAIQEDA